MLGLSTPFWEFHEVESSFKLKIKDMTLVFLLPFGSFVIPLLAVLKSHRTS